jgi:hypothetical protein
LGHEATGPEIELWATLSLSCRSTVLLWRIGAGSPWLRNRGWGLSLSAVSHSRSIAASKLTGSCRSPSWLWGLGARSPWPVSIGRGLPYWPTQRLISRAVPINSAIRDRHTLTEGWMLYSHVAASPDWLPAKFLAGPLGAPGCTPELGAFPVGKPIYSGEKFSKGAPLAAAPPTEMR